MAHEVLPPPFKPHRLDGLSDRLLVSHYENTYGGAVRRLNAVEGRLAGLDFGAAPVFDLNSLSRERLIAANSMILHEAYFDALGGSGEPGGGLARALEREFGSVDRWRAEFAAMGKAPAGGSGWVLLTWSERLGRLTNQWAADHAHTLADGAVVLALDMYEHAYALDFGAKAAAYVDAFMCNIHWERIEARHGRALAPAVPRPSWPNPGVPKVTAAELRGMLDGGEDVTLVDVCLPRTCPGAPTRSPARASSRPRPSPTARATCRATSLSSLLHLRLPGQRRSHRRAAATRLRRPRARGRHHRLAPDGRPDRAPHPRTETRRRVMTKWVTRERPKIGRIACPWLIRCFVEPEAEFLYVPTERVFEVAKETGAVPYDIPGAELFSHDGEFCSHTLATESVS